MRLGEIRRGWGGSGEDGKLGEDRHGWVKLGEAR